MGKTALKNTGNLLLLHMEMRAVRDRVVSDLDAAIAKIARALPAPDESARNREMRTWDRARWRQFRETGR